MNKYSVLHPITGLNIGGAEFMLSRFAGSLQATAFKPSVLSLMAPGVVAKHLGDQGVPVGTLGLGESELALKAIVGLRRAVASSDADILHGWMYHGNLAASLGAIMHRRQPVLWSIHHSIDDVSVEKKRTQWVIRLLARCSKSVAAISYCSRVSANQHEALGFDPLKRAVIPNGVDCSVFRPDDAARPGLRKRFGIPDGRLIIGNVARAHPMKNHGGFVRVLANLRDEGFDVHGLIIGAGHESAEAQRIACETDMHDRLTMPGPMSDIDKLLPGIDIFMLSSAWGEAFPLSVAEAMACGVPCIVTDVGDCRWLVGDDALVSAPQDVDALSAVLRRMLQLEPNERQQLGLAGRRRVLEKFSLEKYTESHLALYEAAISSRPARERAR